MLLARSTCCLFVVGCILILDLIIRSQTSSRSDDVSPYIMVSCAAGAREKRPRTFAHRVPLFNEVVLTSLVCWFVCCFVSWFVGGGIGVWLHRRWSIERHRKSMDFSGEGGCGGPYLCAPSTSARVQSRFEFVELTRDMSSNCTGENKRELEFHAGTSFQAVVYTSSYHTTHYRSARFTCM